METGSRQIPLEQKRSLWRNVHLKMIYTFYHLRIKKTQINLYSIWSEWVRILLLHTMIDGKIQQMSDILRKTLFRYFRFWESPTSWQLISISFAEVIKPVLVNNGKRNLEIESTYRRKWGLSKHVQVKLSSCTRHCSSCSLILQGKRKFRFHNIGTEESEGNSYMALSFVSRQSYL